MTEQVYREDLGFEETVAKVSLQKAQERVKLVLGVELPDLKPAFEDMEEGQTFFTIKTVITILVFQNCRLINIDFQSVLRIRKTIQT